MQDCTNYMDKTDYPYNEIIRNNYRKKNCEYNLYDRKLI